MRLRGLTGAKDAAFLLERLQQRRGRVPPVPFEVVAARGPIRDVVMLPVKALQHPVVADDHGSELVAAKAHAPSTRLEVELVVVLHAAERMLRDDRGALQTLPDLRRLDHPGRRPVGPSPAERRLIKA
jgi:hypothetical protein